MSQNLCVCCRKPMPDTAYACTRCAQERARALLKAAEHAEDAATVIARQARYGGGGRGGSDEPLPVDLTASARLGIIGNTVGGWMRIVLEESDAPEPSPWRPAVGPLCAPRRPGDEPRRGYRCDHASCTAIRDRTPPSALAEACAWLAGQLGWLRKHQAAGEAFRDLERACEDLTRLVDRPADKDLVGMCDCGRTLYAPRGRTVVQCPERTCKLEWNVEESRDILWGALDGKLVTASEAARLAAYLDGDRTQDAIRKLIASRATSGQLAVRGQILQEPDPTEPDAEPEITPTYRFGEVRAVLATIQRRRAREGVAA